MTSPTHSPCSASKPTCKPSDRGDRVICFDPATLTALSVIGTLASTGGAIAAGQAADKEGKYAQAVADKNAEAERMRGQAEADRIEDRYDKLRGQQTAAAAANGINPNAGSASLVINEETGRNQWLDQMSTIWNSESAAQSFEHQGEAARIRGKNSKTGSYIQAAGNFMTGMANAGRVRRGMIV